jgi:tRNA (guanine-N7-)-methyltransferase
MWHEKVFSNDYPLTLELGCGKGEYCLGMAAARTERNFVGVDLKGNRLFVGAREALQAGNSRMAFLRTRIENIAYAFAPYEVDEIWITFPDPQPQKPRERKRLTSPRFLGIYREVLKPGGLIHLKTDHRGFWEYSLETLRAEGADILFSSDNIYRDYADSTMELPAYLVEIQTHYEKLFAAKGHSIHYLCARFQ